MESLNAQLRIVKQKFPGQSERIEELFESDGDFRTLCLDYFLCLRDIQKFEKASTEKETVLEEYKTVLAELEKELNDVIFNQ